jgi:hypothetical protein
MSASELKYNTRSYENNGDNNINKGGGAGMCTVDISHLELKN